MIPTPSQPGQPKPSMSIGPAVNSASIRQGLLRESSYQPNAGSFDGNRAAADFAKQQQYSNAATMNRDMGRQNAQVYGQRQQQGEQMTQDWSRAQMARFRSLTGQKSQQSTLAMRLLEEQINMQSRWQTGLLGMIR